MIGEYLVVLALLLGGSLLARGVGLRGWAVPAVGYALGVALLVGITSLAVVTSLPLPAWVPVVLTVIGPGVWWAWLVSRGEDVRISMTGMVVVVGVTFVLVAGFRILHLVNLTPDSFRYLTTTGLLGSGRLQEASPFLLESRLLAVPVMHMPATLYGELYLRAVTPLLAISCVLILVWVIKTGLRWVEGPPGPIVVAVVAGVWLASMNRFVFHAFYLNGHLALATWLLLLGGVSWLAVQAQERDLVPRLALIQVVVVPAIVLTRPEAGLLAGLVLLPLLVTPRVPDRLRWPALACLGVSVAVWQGFLAATYRTSEGSAPISVDGLLALGIVIVLLSVAISRLGTAWLPRRSLGAVEIVLWLGLVVAVLLDVRILRSSIRATLINLSGDGGWGVSLVVLAVLAVAVLVLTDAPGRAVLRFPLTAFVPLSLLLAYLRDGAYRVGPGDSLNRMLLHLVPVAVLFVVTAFASRRWGLPARSDMVRTSSATPRIHG